MSIANKEQLLADIYAAKASMDTGTVKFMANALTQATIPHRDPKTTYFERINGNLKIRITDTLGYGLPWGSRPRLILSWLTTEVTIKKSKHIELGSSLGEFMEKLGYGKDGRNMNAIKQQVNKLFSSTITVIRENDTHTTWGKMDIAKGGDLSNIWWHQKHENQTSLFKSTITLSDEFYEEIINNPIPVDYRALKFLKRSALALDIYTWLTHKMYKLKPPYLPISWKNLQMQLGTGYSFDKRGQTNFQQAFLKQLNEVKKVYPEANVKPLRGRLMLKPSPTHVPLQRKA